MHKEKKKVLAVIGTRPEVIKMAPIIKLLEKEPSIDLKIVSTAQHRQMLDQMLDLFKIKPHIDLNLMSHNQTLVDLSARLPHPLDEVLKKEKPDFVLAEGDTTTVFHVSLACFYLKIPFGHVEAGLRSGNPYDPFPEEANRRMISRISTLHFAPTAHSKSNLIKEGHDRKAIHVTGNTNIDAMEYVMTLDIPLPVELDPTKKLILVTAHRRENWGDRMKSIFTAIRNIAKRFPDVEILYPVHLNPNVREHAFEILKGQPRVHLIEPMNYPQFIKALQKSYLVLSDSGGVQEEGPQLGIPVLVLRDTTERPEAIEAGATCLIGTDAKEIEEATAELLTNEEHYKMMQTSLNLYGKGNASQLIVKQVKKFLEQ